MKGRTGIGFPGLLLGRPDSTPAPAPASLFSLLSPFILVGLSLLLFFRGIGSRELWASHEARAAQNAQRMLDDGEWLLPRLFDGQVELQKPPGFYWLVAAVGWVRGGVDGWAVRLPSAVAGTVMVLLVWRYLCRRGRPAAGLLAGAILAGAVHFTGTARIGRIDVPLTCAVAAMMLVARDALTRVPVVHPFAWSRLRPFVLVGALGGAALLLKGPIGLFLPAAALGAWTAVEGIPIRRLPVPFVIVGLVSLAIAVPWFVWADYETGGEFVRVFFLFHHFNRAFGGAEALAGHPWWFYVPRFAADFLPWSPLLVAVLALHRWRGDADARFGLVWLAVMVACLSLSRFKRADYLLPAYPGAAIFLGCAVEQWYLARSQPARRRAACAFALILLVLPIGWLVFDHRVTDREEASQEQSPFARRVRETAPAPEPVILFRVESHLLAYHVGRPVHTLVEWGDLNTVLRAAGPHAVVTRAEFLDDCRQHLTVPFEVVARSEDFTRARPHRPLVLLRTVPEACPTPPKD
jgi:4-amino-4-deoxy-L-arabinose transferase-like glycosyltransferase